MSYENPTTLKLRFLHKPHIIAFIELGQFRTAVKAIFVRVGQAQPSKGAGWLAQLYSAG